ncbi:MAG TPA: exonuclease domain-containing protein [Chloroflexia bacterium]|nr:exonuclease domain-containing protein [Chloroflexia bacterium]
MPEIARDIALSGATFAVVDVETTGLSARTGDRICELAVVVAREGEIVDSFQTLVNPQRPISRGALMVNGISDSMVRDAPAFRSVAPALVRALRGTVLVAHNASFDLSFISAELRMAGYEPPSNPVVDTLALARRCYSFKSNRLGEVARTLGIETKGLHRAMADAVITWEVLKCFMKDFRSFGINTLADITRLQGALTPLSGWYTAPPLMEWDGTQAACPIEGLPPMILQAVRAQSTLRIRYKGSDGKQSERVVEPRKVTLREQATYLVAYCHLKHEERTFRLDRIVELTLESAAG